MEEKKEAELKNTTVVLMIATAVFFDVLQWLLTFIFMGWAAGFFAYLTFFLWFKLHGISFMKINRLAAFGGATLIEIIPFISVLPAWTFAVSYIALGARIQEVIPGGNITKLDIMNKK